MSGDGERVGSEGSLGAWVVEVQHGAVVLDEVHLLDALDLIHSQFLQRRLQLLIIGCSGLVDDLLLASGSA